MIDRGERAVLSFQGSFENPDSPNNQAIDWLVSMVSFVYRNPYSYASVEQLRDGEQCAIEANRYGNVKPVEYLQEFNHFVTHPPAQDVAGI
jgi:hypothetical protein